MISESEGDNSCEEGQDVARRRLDEALIQKKKQFQNLRNIKGRTIKRRDTDKQQRLTAFKESYKGKKEVPQRNKPWSVLEWQNHWNSLDQRQQDNLDRKKSHCHLSIGSKINEMAADYNASVICLIRYPNGTQHTKYVLVSGGGIKYSKSRDGVLTEQLWHRYWNKKQNKRQQLCEENGLWLERASKRKRKERTVERTEKEKSMQSGNRKQRKRERQFDNESVESEEEYNERLDSGIENQNIGKSHNETVESEEDNDERLERGIWNQTIGQTRNESVESDEENDERLDRGIWKQTTGDNGNNERVESDEENDVSLDRGIWNHNKIYMQNKKKSLKKFLFTKKKIGETSNVESEEEYDGRWDKGIGSQKIRQSDNESVRSEEENFEIWGKWGNR
ncbi:golgin subfamily A member 6-like protein 2 isoform X1 [Daphnia magna]|uniref:golgin subfamily A member 6-like protein 2 isoform X1 n=1 Tax=Daphnia magna TaxID=35525 RepID=UPI001E1BAB19|nr:golgin subfamily A member 6-like protein 2 isoform X1 [Daphnia magna]